MQLPTSPESVAMSKDLRRRGWSFVGPTTVYSFMEAMGLVNDHLVGCAIPRAGRRGAARLSAAVAGSGLALGPALGRGSGHGAGGAGGKRVGRLAGEERRPIGERRRRKRPPRGSASRSPPARRRSRSRRASSLGRSGSAAMVALRLRVVVWGSAARAGRGHLAMGAGPARGAVLSGESVDAIGRHGAAYSVCGVHGTRFLCRFEVSSRKRVRLALRSAPRWSPPPRSRFTFALTGPRLIAGGPRQELPPLSFSALGLAARTAPRRPGAGLHRSHSRPARGDSARARPAATCWPAPRPAPARRPRSSCRCCSGCAADARPDATAPDRTSAR